MRTSPAPRGRPAVSRGSPSGRVEAMTTSSRRRAPGLKRSRSAARRRPTPAAPRKASEKSSGSRPPRLPSAPTTSMAVTDGGGQPGGAATSAPTRATAPHRGLLLHARDRGPERAPAEHAETPAASRPAATMTAMPSARIGPISRVALKSATASTSIATTTIAPAERIAGAGALGGARHRVARVLGAAQLLAVAGRSAGSSRCPRRTSARSGSRSPGR